MITYYINDKDVYNHSNPKQIIRHVRLKLQIVSGSMPLNSTIYWLQPTTALRNAFFVIIDSNKMAESLKSKYLNQKGYKIQYFTPRRLNQDHCGSSLLFFVVHEESLNCSVGL